MSEQPILKPEHFQVSRFQKRQLKGKRCKLPQWGPVRSPGHQRIFACNLGWEIAASGDEFPSWSPWPYFYMGVSNTFPKLGRVNYGMELIYKPKKWSGLYPRSVWKSTAQATHKHEINLGLTVAMCCAELETAARH